MNSDIAIQRNSIEQNAHAMNGVFSMDQSLILNTLQDMTADEKRDATHLWRLTRAALNVIRNLQHRLTETQAEIVQKDKLIKELEAIATTDQLTSIANRRGFFDAFDREMDRVNRGLVQGGLLIMVDMDNFKMINDTYGHAVGDEALKLVSQTLSAHIRKMDVVARLGGDEFVVIFSNTTRALSAERAQKLARKLNSLTLTHEGHRIPVRASLGMQPYQKGESIEGIMDRADARMYKSKEERKAQKA